jgi:precorrin-2 dehydrogenase/sirohydrochlorin ferrochelatase
MAVPNTGRRRPLMPTPALFPIFLKLRGRRAVVAGGGPLAQSKLAGLLRAAADVVVVAPEATRRIRALAEQGRVQWKPREFKSADVRGAFLVIAATNSSAINRAVFRACRRAKVLCNVVDDPEFCDFFYPAVARRGALQIAISTAGASPALAQRLRRELEEQFGPEYARWLQAVARERQKVLKSKLPPEEKRRRLHRIVSREAFQEFLEVRRAAKA